MNRSAPRVIHIGEKGTGNFVQLPYSLLEGLFAKLDGRHGNAIKVMIYLLGLKGDGSFKLSKKWILKQTGMSAQKYYETMQYLEQEGLIERMPGSVILVNINEIANFNNHRDEKNCSHDDAGKWYRDAQTLPCDDAHNINPVKEDHEEKTLIHEKEKDRFTEDDFRSVLADVGIGYSKHTMNLLRKCAGEEIEVCVLQEIIRENRNAFDRGMTQKEGYRFGTLKNLVRDHYEATKRKLGHLESLSIPINRDATPCELLSQSLQPRQPQECLGYVKPEYECINEPNGSPGKCQINKPLNRPGNSSKYQSPSSNFSFPGDDFEDDMDRFFDELFGDKFNSACVEDERTP